MVTASMPASGYPARFTILCMCLAMSACAVSRHNVEQTHEKLAAELALGDRVELVLENGQRLTFRVTEIRDTELVGDTSTDITKGKIVTVPYAEISRLERVDQHPLVLLGTVAAVPVAALAIGFIAFIALTL